MPSITAFTIKEYSLWTADLASVLVVLYKVGMEA
jgi:hypothetical protein